MSLSSLLSQAFVLLLRGETTPSPIHTNSSGNSGESIPEAAAPSIQEPKHHHQQQQQASLGDRRRAPAPPAGELDESYYSSYPVRAAPAAVAAVPPSLLSLPAVVEEEPSSSEGCHQRELLRARVQNQLAASGACLCKRCVCDAICILSCCPVCLSVCMYLHSCSLYISITRILIFYYSYCCSAAVGYWCVSTGHDIHRHHVQSTISRARSARSEQGSARKDTPEASKGAAEDIRRGQPSASSSLMMDREAAAQPSHSNGIYFRKNAVDFGAVAVGNISRTKVELCNSTNEEVILTIQKYTYNIYILTHICVICSTARLSCKWETQIFPLYCCTTR